MSYYEMDYSVNNLDDFDARKDNRILRELYNAYAKKLCIDYGYEDMIEYFMIKEDCNGMYKRCVSLPMLGKDDVSRILAGEDVVWLISYFWKYVCLHQNLSNVQLVFEYGYNGSGLYKETVEVDALKVTEKEESLFHDIDYLYENINKIDGYYILVKFKNLKYSGTYVYILESDKPAVGKLVETSPKHYGLIIKCSKEPIADLYYYAKCKKTITIKEALKKKYILEDHDLLALCCRYYINNSDYKTATLILNANKEDTSTPNLINELLIKYEISNLELLKSADKNWLDDPLANIIIKRKSWEAEIIKAIKKELMD